MANLMVLCMRDLRPINHVLNGLSVDVRRHFFLQLLFLQQFVFLCNFILNGLDGFHLISRDHTAVLGRQGGSGGGFLLLDFIVKLVHFLALGLRLFALVAAAFVFLASLFSLTLALFFCSTKQEIKS